MHLRRTARLCSPRPDFDLRCVHAPIVTFFRRRIFVSGVNHPAFPEQRATTGLLRSFDTLNQPLRTNIPQTGRIRAVVFLLVLRTVDR